MPKSVSARPGRRPSRTGGTLRCRRGASALEFALVGAILFLTMLAAIEVGRYFMTLEGLRNLKADAMRHGIIVQVTTDATFNFVVTVFGLASQRITDDVTVTFRI